MIFNVKNTRKRKAKVYDSVGVEIPYCFEYNSKTREAKLFLTGTHKGNTRVLKKSLKPNK